MNITKVPDLGQSVHAELSTPGLVMTVPLVQRLNLPKLQMM